MKKMLAVITSVMVAGSIMSSVVRADVLLGADKATWSPYSIETVAKNETDMKIGLPNPFIDVKDLKEAEKLTGVKLTVPKSIKGYDKIIYQAMKDEKMAQVYYKNNNEDSVLIRKAISKEDISGDYKDYKKIKKVKVRGYKVTLKGDGKTYSLAVWKKGKYSYSVGIYNENEKGMRIKQITNIIKQVK